MKPFATRAVVCIVTAVVLFGSGTITKVQAAEANLLGDWENADSTFKLEFQERGKCYISAGPVTSQCTYQQNGGKTIVKFKDEELILTANEDGSLSSPPDYFLPFRLKKKP